MTTTESTVEKKNVRVPKQITYLKKYRATENISWSIKRENTGSA